jgi:hypothetical protein
MPRLRVGFLPLSLSDCSQLRVTCSRTCAARHFSKGGVGKTLLAVNIAAVLAARGNDVLLIDGDEQSSAATFAQIRSELAGPAKFTTVQLQGAAIRQQMKALRSKYREIIIDVGGRDTGSLRAALDAARPKRIGTVENAPAL